MFQYPLGERRAIERHDDSAKVSRGTSRSSAHQQYRHRTSSDHFVRDTAQPRALEPAASVSRHHDERRAHGAGVVGERRRGRPIEKTTDALTPAARRSRARSR